MTDRTWIPTDWLDEMVTGMAAHPTAFLRRNDAGVLELRPLPDDETSLEKDGVAEWRIKPLKEGDVVLFSWTENYGTGLLTVRPDRSWTCDTEFPDTATHFWLPYDVSTMESSVGALVSGEGDWNPDGEPLEPGEHEVGAYTWGPAVAFKVRALESGAAEFVEVGTEQ